MVGKTFCGYRTERGMLMMYSFFLILCRREDREETTMSLLRHGKAWALTIYLGEADQWHGQSLYVALMQLLRDSGCAGATVTRAVAGYGAGARLHEQGGLRLSSDA